MTLAPARP
ncbi:hypothetical protein E2C01_099334 [Portunus trituberculatus]|uniref:Uncharacterized protein n=1 Tax=Portunus trituberculatus TaxID=210409 RepID=A0A5B7KAQ4_PORTR|nr:hypothetical protein [Portunus trituberculatus]